VFTHSRVSRPRGARSLPGPVGTFPSQHDDIAAIDFAMTRVRGSVSCGLHSLAHGTALSLDGSNDGNRIEWSPRS
jgi:hypothetical protein